MDQDVKKLEDKLDVVVKLLQSLFILEAKKFGIKKGDVRAILGTKTDAVTDVWKYLKDN